MRKRKRMRVFFWVCVCVCVCVCVDGLLAWDNEMMAVAKDIGLIPTGKVC